MADAEHSVGLLLARIENLERRYALLKWLVFLCVLSTPATLVLRARLARRPCLRP